MSKRRPGSKHFQALHKGRWAVVRLQVLDRDGRRCRRCGKAGRLEVHHVQALEHGGRPYDLDNLISWCRSCHIAHHRAQALALRPQAAAWAAAVDELLPR